MLLALGDEGPLLDDIRWHGLAPWVPPELPADREKFEPRPDPVRERVGPHLWEMKPPYYFARHPVPADAELGQMFETE